MRSCESKNEKMNAEEKMTDCGENKKKNIPTVLEPKKNSYSTQVFPWKFIGFKDGDESQNNNSSTATKVNAPVLYEFISFCFRKQVQ